MNEMVAHLVGCTSGAVGNETGIDASEAEVDVGRPARHDFTVDVEKRMRQRRFRLDAELEPLVQVGAVQQPTVDVPADRFQYNKQSKINQSTQLATWPRKHCRLLCTFCQM